MTTEANLERWVGDDWGIDFQVIDPATGQPLDITDPAVTMEFEMTRQNIRRIHLTRAGGGITAEANGNGSVLVPREAAEVLDPGHYHWRLRITHPTRGRFTQGHGLIWVRG